MMKLDISSIVNGDNKMPEIQFQGAVKKQKKSNSTFYLLSSLRTNTFSQQCLLNAGLALHLVAFLILTTTLYNQYSLHFTDEPR